MSRLIRNIRYPSPECHCVSVDSHYRMEFIVALLEQDLEAPPGAAPWLTPWQHSGHAEILVFGFPAKCSRRCPSSEKSCG